MKQRLFSLFMVAAALVLLNACDKKDDRTTIPKPEPEEPIKLGVLPVVFHVFYADENDATQKVPAERLRQVLDNVNRLYQGVYSGAGNANIRFLLTPVDKAGNRLDEPGVEYIKLEESEYPIDPYVLMNDKSGKYKRYMWDPNRFINVYVYHFKQAKTNGTTLGISHMPISAKGEHELEGLLAVQARHLTLDNLPTPFCVSVNSKYVNEESNRYKDWPNLPFLRINSADFNVTLAHELGHYLGLFHVFGEEDGEYIDGFKDTDYCKDTPTYNKVAYDKFLAEYIQTHNAQTINLKDLLKRTGSDGKTFDSNNIMDYAISLGHTFTQDQTERMRHVLNYSLLIPRPGSRSRSVDAHDKPKGVVDVKFRVIE